MYNKIIMLGNLTRDIELRYLPSGSAIAKSAIATSHKYKNQAGVQQDEVCFLDFTLFGRSGEVANQYLKKGSKVLLEGRLIFEQWTAQDGTTRSKHSLRVETMKMLDSKSDSQNQGGYNPQHQASGQSDNAESNHNYNTPPAMDRKIPEIDIDEDEIPFNEATAPIHNADKFYVKCISCESIFNTDEYDLDLEHDGDICGLCPKCNCSKIFFEVDKNGRYK